MPNKVASLSFAVCYDRTGNAKGTYCVDVLVKPEGPEQEREYAQYLATSVEEVYRIVKSHYKNVSQKLVSNVCWVAREQS